MHKLTGRGAMRSPGAPSLRRKVERRFWQQIATEVTGEKAAEAVGVFQPAGTRWFRHRGGMPLFLLSPASGRYLLFAERKEIALLRAQGHQPTQATHAGRPSAAPLQAALEARAVV